MTLPFGGVTVLHESNLATVRGETLGLGGQRRSGTLRI